MYGKKIFVLFFAGLLLIFSGFYLGQSSPQNKIQSKPLITPQQNVLSPTPSSNSAVLNDIEQKFKVLRVVDGDTIDIDIIDKKERVRLIGIDTPEIVDPRKPVACFGKESAEKAEQVLNNQLVFLEKDETQGEKDKYQRLLRYVFLEDGTNFNKLMISQGFAKEYTYKIPYKYQSEFRMEEKEAKDGKKGLWLKCI